MQISTPTARPTQTTLLPQSIPMHDPIRTRLGILREV
jgi:hypothetical protein